MRAESKSKSFSVLMSTPLLSLHTLGQDHHFQQSRQSPSPTHNQHLQSSSRNPNAHRRRDSDTLRGLVPPNSATLSGTGSPTVLDGNRLQVRHSPPGGSKGRVSPPTAKGRLSPSASKGRVSPPTAKGRNSPPNERGRLSPAINAGREVAKHRRSPTAPEPPTSASMMRESNGVSSNPIGKTWAGASRGERDDEYDQGHASSGERERERERDREKERERERERERRGHQSHLSLQQQPSSQQQYAQLAPPPPPPAQFNRHIVVSGPYLSFPHYSV
jgi:serine/threonine-protein kinase TTK/MPS1